MPPRRGTGRVVAVPENRFAAGWRLLPGIEVAPGNRPQVPEREPSFVVDVVRGRDLVALTVELYDVDLVTSAAGAILRPKPGAGGDARLVARFGFQHLAERALYETPAGKPPLTPDEKEPDAPPKDYVPPAGSPPDPPNARHQPPIDALPARASRIVYAVPQGEEIPFSTEGILAALGRLPMVVHPLATPRVTRLRPDVVGPVVTLPGGLIGTLAAGGVLISEAGRRAARHDTGTVEGLDQHARDLRRTRAALAVTGGMALGVRGRELEGGAQELVVGNAVHGVRDLLGAGGLAIRPDAIAPGRFRRPRYSRPPEQLETAIEAPFRLVISPSELNGWAHATKPVGAEGAEHRVELWHTRLGVRDGDRVDEVQQHQRAVRAIWAGDRNRIPDWQDDETEAARHEDVPFRSSLDGADRHMLVRQSAETWPGANGLIAPEPVDARALWLSALGAWLELHGAWETGPYSQAVLASILSWDHVAPMGRDQFVRVVYPGFLFPIGHRAALVKLTERKMKDAAPSTAGLFQRKFLVIGEPVRTYTHAQLPLSEIRVAPLVTPTLDDPGDAQSSFFWPTVGGPSARFEFVLHCLDHEGRPVNLPTPLIWVAEHFGQTAANFNAVNAAYVADPDSTIGAFGQKIAYARARKGGDTLVPTTDLTLEATRELVDGLTKARPLMVRAKVELPAVQALSPTDPLTISYAKVFLDNGFGSEGPANHANKGDIWAKVDTPRTLEFGGGGGGGGAGKAGSDKSGGFLQPNMPIEGISRLTGPVGDIAGMAKQEFDPATFLDGLGDAFPKLFGLVPLTDLLEKVVDLDKMPTVVSEALDRIVAFRADLERARAAAEEAVADAQRLVNRGAAGAAAALADAEDLRDMVTDAVDQVIAVLSGASGTTQAAIDAAIAAPLDALRDAVAKMEEVAPKLPPLVRNHLLALAKVLRAVLEAADLVDDIVRLLNGFDPSSVQVRFRFEWRPRVASWPSPAKPFLGITEPILVIDDPDNALVLAVDGRASGKGEMRVDVLAELRDFSLLLLPGTPLVRFDFDHLSFHAGSTGKPEVDVVLQDIEFLGILGFVETLKELIPFDGFSDPPYLDVSPEGMRAGFSLALPNVAVGVFALSNISLGADVHVPFLGKVVTVGFNFCTRERPFTLQVTFIGGGGWFLLRLSPDGLDLLELGLEAGATLSVDFGVASGSISAMIGVYIRLEGAKGSLTGYLRLRGEVDVLGLISASIELYLELEYQFDTGKMFGRARLTIEVKVFVFSGSVTIECERQFAGSKGDPTFRQLLAVADDGTSALWSEYCSAFASEED